MRLPMPGMVTHDTSELNIVKQGQDPEETWTGIEEDRMIMDLVKRFEPL